MVFFNYALRKLNAKIVYYGPGLCGKTTNLVWIHDHFDGGERGKMISLATEGDRTIFFDLLPIEIGSIRGMDVTLQLYTVPGQVHYNSTRQLVLRGADGVVFVADSQRAMQSSNVDSFKNLQENLLLQGISLDGFPHVLQFNKRDLRDTVSMEELNDDLNRYSVPIFEAVATEGVGVQETLEGIVKLVMRNLRERYEGAAAGARTRGFEDPSISMAVPTSPKAPAAGPAPPKPATPTPAPQAPVTPPASPEPFSDEPFPQEPFPQEQAPAASPPREPVAPPDGPPPAPPVVQIHTQEQGATTVDFSKTQGPEFITGFGDEDVDMEAPTAVYDLGGEAEPAVPETPAREEAPPAVADDAGAEQKIAEDQGVLEIGGDPFTDMETGDHSPSGTESPETFEPPPEPEIEAETAQPDEVATLEFELDTGEPEAAPEPLPEPPPEPLPEPPIEPPPEPEPIPDFAFESTPEPVPPPDAETVPEATQESAPDMVSDTIPQPVYEPAPEPEPAQTLEAAPESFPDPTTEFVPEPFPDPTTEVVPEPAPEAAPAPPPDTVAETPVESFADIDTESVDVAFLSDEQADEAPPVAAEEPPAEGRYEDWISAPSPFAPKPPGEGPPRDIAKTFAAISEKTAAGTEEAVPEILEPADEVPAVLETVAIEVPPQPSSEPETVAFEVPQQEPPEFVEMPEPEMLSEAPAREEVSGGEGAPFEAAASTDDLPPDDFSETPVVVDEIEPPRDFSETPVSMDEIEPLESHAGEPMATVEVEPLEEIAEEPPAMADEELFQEAQPEALVMEDLEPLVEIPAEPQDMERPEPLEEVAVAPEEAFEDSSYADIEVAEFEEPPAAIEPAASREVSVSAEDNQLQLRLQGTGAIIESGQVRELDIEVPVPGAWVGNRRVTLQLRLTLTPDTENEDAGNSPS